MFLIRDGRVHIRSSGLSVLMNIVLLVFLELKGAYDYYIQGAEGLDKKAATDALFYMGHNPTPLNLKEFWETKKKNGI